MPRRQNSRWKSRLQRVCSVQCERFYSWAEWHFISSTYSISTTRDDWCSCYSQTGVSIPMNPHINSEVSLRFIALQKFVTRRMSCCVVLRGDTWSPVEQLHCAAVDLSVWAHSFQVSAAPWKAAGQESQCCRNKIPSFMIITFTLILSNYLLHSFQTTNSAAVVHLFQPRQPCRVFEWAVEEVRIHLGLRERLVSHSQVKPWNLLGCSLFWTALLVPQLSLS